MRNIYIICLLIHFYKGKKVGNNLILPVNLRCNIRKKLLIKLFRNTFLTYKRICKHLHGRHRSLQLVRHIGNKFLSRFIQHLHSSQHLVKRICDQSCLCIIRHRNIFILIAVCQILDCLCHSCKRLYKNRREDISKKNGKHNNASNNKNLSLFQCVNSRCNLTCGNRYKHSSLKLFYIRAYNGNCYLQCLIPTVKTLRLFSLKTLYHKGRNKCLSLICTIRIFYYSEVPVYKNNPSAVNIRQQLQLAVYNLRAGVIEIIFLYQQAAQNVTLASHTCTSVCNGFILIVCDNRSCYNDTWHNSQNDQNNQDTKAKTFKKVFLCFFLHSLSYAWK